MQLYRPRHKTAHRALHWHFRSFALFYHRRYQTDTSGYNTACATLEHITAPQHLQLIPEIPAQRRDAVQVSTAAYYNNVYKARRLLWIHARQCSRSQTMQARRRSAPTVCESPASADTLSAVQTRRLVIWHRSAVRAHRFSSAQFTRQGSPAAGARRAARNHWRLPPYLFSGFRPIANRGQQ